MASMLIELKEGLPAKFKLIFVQDKRKKDWQMLLSTDTSLADEEIVCIYGKRWGIEVFFKMNKHHLKLAKELQCGDFDALIANTTIMFMRYIFVVYQCRIQTDYRTFGDLFYACCDEVKDISFIEALNRILTLVADQLRKLGTIYEKTAAVFFDAVVEAV